jgi:FAD/FMN-containing dehydrogenase
MALSREIYKEFEDAVGSDNISDDPVLLDTYRYPLTATGLHLGPFYNVMTPRCQAVILPANTREVQDITRICNRFKIQLKASSTFWAAMGYPTEENSIQLDMSRMDRILEIDKKNMFAVVEPGVIAATLQAEAMKVGLNTHMIGAGASHSPLASAVSWVGSGPDSVFMGYGSENLLGAEWVMPDGELVNVGSAGSQLGWFCSEGPGPSVRAIFRGIQGAKGSLGVFTKCSLKLFAWPGPPKIQVKGTAPAYQAVLPDNFRAYTLAFSSWKGWADACHLIWDSEIGYILHRQFNKLGRDLKLATIKILTDPTKTLSDLENLLKNPEIQKATEEMQRDFQIVLAGMTARDIIWQEKALDHILANTGGWKVAAMNDPVIQNWSLLYLIRLGHKSINLIYSGGYDGCFGLMGPPDFGTAHVEEAGGFKKEWEAKGNIVAAGGDCMMGSVGTIGGGGICGWENFTHFDPYSKESSEGTLEFFEAATKFASARKIGPSMENFNAVCRGPDGKSTSKPERDRMMLSSPQPAVFRYQKKIKDAFDPNNLGDTYYSTLDV